ncbi:MAG: hypothetical protein HYV97_02745 [Bdellovibrio sp.]|nr:hypothetical protein [Bdellovibrio sp.]
MDPAQMLYFPIYFIVMWLSLTCLLGLLSGWYSLMDYFPDQKEKALLTLKHQGGTMGLVSMSGILILAVCPSGLRLGIMRIFGPFSRSIFVPWKQLSITRKQGFFGRKAILQFGTPQVGKISIAGYIADRLQKITPEQWPESNTIFEETRTQALQSVCKIWLLRTSCAAAFFMFAPMIVAPQDEGVSKSMCISFPAIVFGFVALGEYWYRIKHLRK